MNAPTPPRPTWTTGTTELIKTGTWRAAIPVYGHPPSPCRTACPVEGRIADWIGFARSGDLFGAWTTLVQANPFPSIVGRVCHRPCESACNRSGYDEAVAVRALERHVGDAALAAGWRFPALDTGRQRVAVVGGGPSGLSAAYQLRRRGYAVTIFEAQRELGGLLRYGIPPYRLPRTVLDAEIGRVLQLGIDVCTGSAIADAQQFLHLRQEFDAVYFAPGARRQKVLPQVDARAPWCLDSAAYLAAANAGAPPRLGKRVAVIGGGSAAMDVARSARLAGHEVSVLALEPEFAMPAQAEEVIAARNEGVALHAATHLKSVSTNVALELHCEHVHMKGADPLDFDPISGTEFTLRADAIVMAIGQDPDLAPFRPLLALNGPLLATDGRHATNLSGVFAGGDVSSRARFVTQAIGMGREAAAEIDRWLIGDVSLVPQRQSPVPLDAISTFYHPRIARTADTDGLSAEAALAESARCFSCGRCTLCDNCFRYCPDMAVRRVAGGYEIAAEYCKGCGLCVQECPTGALAMREEWR